MNSKLKVVVFSLAPFVSAAAEAAVEFALHAGTLDRNTIVRALLAGLAADCTLLRLVAPALAAPPAPAPSPPAA